VGISRTGSAERQFVALVLALFAVVFAGLSAKSGVERSATVDEPTHLIAGYAALAASDYRLDPSHPPLVRMWAALPLLAFTPPSPPSAAIDRASARTWLASSGPGDVAREFLYSRPDADWWLNASRMMIVLLGVALGVLVFAWAYAWRGLRVAGFALACYTLSPNISAHAALVTTDLGVTLCIFAAAYLLWRVCSSPTWGRALGLALAVAAAVLTKFSGVILGPVVLAALVVAAWRRPEVTPARAAAIAGLVAGATIFAIWAAYGFRYAPSPSPGWVFDVPADAAAHAPMPLARVASWIDSHHLLPNAFTQGLLSCAIGSVQRAYLLGQVSDYGWWYYFPVAFLLKTPFPLIALLAVGLIAWVADWRKLGWRNEALIIAPAAAYLIVAMASGINIGIRHLLPVYPFVFMIAGVAADRLYRARHRTGRLALAGLLTLWVVSVGRAYPHTLGVFNVLAGGPENGLAYLSDSNVDWGQHLKLLRDWMDEHDVRHLNLAYFGQADPHYYGIDCTYLPVGVTFASRVAQPPVLPGYVAISATVLSGVYLDRQWRVFYSGFRNLTPAAEIGHSIRVYWIDHWPEAVDGAERIDLSAAPDVEAALANRLLFTMRWPRLAAAHYRHYLQHRPQDAEALANYGTALQVAGDPAGGLAALRQAVALVPQDAGLHVSLGLALLSAGRSVEAETEARKALALEPHSAAPFDLLGRATALQGRLSEAVAAFERALAIDPGSAEARADLDRIRPLVRNTPDVLLDAS
jgi:4-amino-4-deoxy-L-arabinose transferase-like glycosyltransferase